MYYDVTELVLTCFSSQQEPQSLLLHKIVGSTSIIFRLCYHGLIQTNQT